MSAAAFVKRPSLFSEGSLLPISLVPFFISYLPRLYSPEDTRQNTCCQSPQSLRGASGLMQQSHRHCEAAYQALPKQSQNGS